MRSWSKLLLFSLVLAAFGCGSQRPATPVETFKTYVKAIQQKDTETMKLLLSSATVRMHEQEAKAQGVTVDEIMKRETLFTEGQRTVEYKNEKIDGERATLEVKNSYGSWETVPFLLEDGVWKIDKHGYANQIIQDVEDSERRFDELMNASTPPPANQDDPFYSSTPSPADTPENQP